jgi:uncharacterized damage-inducible protein DinB
MFTAETAQELHSRTHTGTARILEHCRQLSADELTRDLSVHGFGVATVHEQLHHIISAEQYWVGVLRGRFMPGVELTPEESHDYEVANFPTVETLAAYREKTAAATREWLGATTPEQLAAPTECGVWGGSLRTLLPAMVLMRVLTHHHHHRGQVAAMCRLLGYPPPESPALDFPLGP